MDAIIRKTNFVRSINGRTLTSYRFLSKRYGSEGNNVNVVDVPRGIKFIPDFNETSMQWWVFKYADLSPYSEKDIVGTVFLSTNTLFFLAGITVYFDSTKEGTLFPLIYSFALDIAGFASTIYHYNQLHYGKYSIKVINSLIIDYIVAFGTILCYLIDLFTNHSDLSSIDSLLFSILALLCLFASWVYEYGLPYMFFHGLWHIFCSIAVIKLHSL